MPTAVLRFTTVPVTSVYGWRVLSVSGLRNHHDGTDTGNGTKYPHSAFGDGVVVESPQKVKHWKYGWYIRIEHAPGIETSHHSFDGPALFKEGQKVRLGDIVGFAGRSALAASGNHVHHALWLDGKHVDPLLHLTPGIPVTVTIGEPAPAEVPTGVTPLPLPLPAEGNDMLLIHKTIDGRTTFALTGGNYWVEFTNSTVNVGEPANSFAKQVGGNSVEVSESFWNTMKRAAQ